MAKETVVIGLGNPLMADEGIGCRLIECLSADCGRFPNADFVDAGTGGMNLLHLLADRRRAILLDCAEMGAEPGRIRRFGPDDVESVKQLAHLSLHECDIIKVIDMARRLGQCPDEIIIFGVQPGGIAPAMGLTEELAGRVDEYVELIAAELAT